MSTENRPLRDRFVEEKLRRVLKPLGLAQCICWLAIIASPFLWIWGSWSIAWKTALTGFVAVLIIGMVARYLRKIAASF